MGFCGCDEESWDGEKILNSEIKSAEVRVGDVMKAGNHDDVAL